MAAIIQHRPDFPHPPWRLAGCALLRLQLMPLNLATVWVPSPLKVVPVLPGHTLGAFFLAQYRAGSTLQYHELIVAPAIARYGTWLGAWVSHIYVDSELSVAGGKEIWALPKQLAQFHWALESGKHRVEVSQGEQLLCCMQLEASKWNARLPLWAPVLSRDHERLLSFRAIGSSKVSCASADLHIPGHSPFAPLGFNSGRAWQLQELELNVTPPEFGRRF